jgi:hypothetical protein
MTHYLYGAKVQGIQSFIFETNKLREIGGASELIESLSGDGLKKFFKEVKVTYEEKQLLRNAAGEILYEFQDEGSCKKVVREFEHHIATKMPGLSVSQAVVPMEKQFVNLKDASQEVNRLLQIQRNRPSPPPELGWMISERARRTGRPGTPEDKKGDLIDRRQRSKRMAEGNRRLHEKLIGATHPFEKEDFAFELEDITGNRERAWLAVVHADGNNLGKLIQKLLPKLPAQKLKEGYRQFSLKLEEATQAAAQAAYQLLLDRLPEKERDEIKGGNRKLPIRPVVIGGDDLTVILRAEHAVAFTEAYLSAFEDQTKQLFHAYAKEFNVLEYFEHGLTACAGIAIVKPKYPFHYAADLAEELCSWTKKIAKKVNDKHTPSSLHFHKVQASFVEFYADIVERELTSADGKALLTAGPYFLWETQGDAPTISQLLTFEKILRDKKTPTGPLRDYLGELKVDVAAAHQKLERIKDLNPEASRQLDLNQPFRKSSKSDKVSTHLYDALQLATL